MREFQRGVHHQRAAVYIDRPEARRVHAVSDIQGVYIERAGAEGQRSVARYIGAVDDGLRRALADEHLIHEGIHGAQAEIIGGRVLTGLGTLGVSNRPGSYPTAVAVRAAEISHWTGKTTVELHQWTAAGGSLAAPNGNGISIDDVSLAQQQNARQSRRRASLAIISDINLRRR